MMNNRAVILLGILLFTVDASYSVLGFVSSTNGRKPLSVPSSSTSLQIATIDAGEVFDSTSFFGVGTNQYLESDCLPDSGFNSAGGEAVASTKDAIDGVSNSGLAWAAIGALLSISAAVNTNAFSSSLRLLNSIASWYLTRLEVAPLLTKCITGGIIALIGDYGAQWFEFKLSRTKDQSSTLVSPSESAVSSLRAEADTPESISKPSFSIHGSYDIRRGIARFLECLLISSPLMHYGYDLFESIMPVVGGASGLYRSLAALSHVFADSVFLDGIFVATGILFTGIFEGHSVQKYVLPNLRNVYLPTLKASVLASSALMPIQFLSFRFLPVQLRVLSVNAVDLIWTAVVSFASHNGDTERVAHACDS